ncbi:MAG TPA: copper resistance CopC family protein [Candidatus Binataceae bacterium]|nr:copper resistance CopC family protein [Candidatus Binataceae bacterium]
MTSKPVRSFVLALVVMLSTTPVARAHSFPQEQHPSAGETLSTAPQEIRIKFDAPIEKLFAKLQVVDSSGKDYAVGTPQISSDGIELTEKVEALKPGEYTVRWAVVCIDTHHTEGSYSFTIKGGGV